MPRIPARGARSSRLVGRTAVASAEVATTRLVALADPRAFGGVGQQREIARMVSEKADAGAAGLSAGYAEACLLPWRVAAACARPDLFTAHGMRRLAETWWSAWLAVGDATLRPAAKAVAQNRTRLRAAARR